MRSLLQASRVISRTPSFFGVWSTQSFVFNRELGWAEGLLEVAAEDRDPEAEYRARGLM